MMHYDFWSYVEKTDGCWLWNGPTRKEPKPYGLFHPKRGQTISAHRWSYILVHGDIPAGLLVCHSCDNPRCVRPDHLFLGTNKENRLDAQLKGRLRRRWREQDILRMRELHTMGWSYWRIAKEYKTTGPDIGHIIRRDTWKHI